MTEPCILDGEIVAMHRGRPSFSRLASRMQLTRAREIDAAVTDTPVHFLVFDILSSESQSLLDAPYTSRRIRLSQQVTETPHILVPPSFGGDIDSAMATSAELGLEGVVAKRAESPYRPGERSRDWVKIKHHLTQEVVVIGWRTGRGSRNATFGSLLLVVPDGDSLRYVGRVGTGFSDVALKEATRKLAPLARKSPPAQVPAAEAADAKWLTPRLVGEVSYAEVTPDGRLRHPVWKGWRTDKLPSEIVREDA